LPDILKKSGLPATPSFADEFEDDRNQKSRKRMGRRGLFFNYITNFKHISHRNLNIIEIAE
jgi:hypothetical protein